MTLDHATEQIRQALMLTLLIAAPMLIVGLAVGLVVSVLQAATQAHLDVDRLSFTGCFQILKCRLPECARGTPEAFAEWVESVLWEMQQEVIEPRRNRINPRVIKRKMSKWPKKRPEHRRLPPLKKRFEETVVMVN